jgi:hypothetical protein
VPAADSSYRLMERTTDTERLETRAGGFDPDERRP